MTKVTFTSADAIDKEAFGTWNGEKVRLSYSLKVANSHMVERYPIQGRESKWTSLTMWGCVDNKENADFLTAFAKLDADLYTQSRRREDSREEMVKYAFHNDRTTINGFTS